MKRAFWFIEKGDTAIIATAIHSGHEISERLLDKLALSDADRLREEDPYTDLFTEVTDNRVVVYHSRFEVDLNRPRDMAVYRKPEDAWGLTVWKSPLSQEDIAKSLSIYDRFYGEMERFLQDIQNRFQNFVVLDIHSYNHHRMGPDAPFDDPEENPDINIGTDTIKNPENWRGLIDDVIATMHHFDYFGRHLDVRENVKFGGGYFAEWIHEKFLPNACVISVEFKKFFMDEWTGEADPAQLKALRELMQSTIPVIEKHLEQLSDRHE